MAMEIKIMGTLLRQIFVSSALGVAASVVLAPPLNGHGHTDERVIGRSLQSVYARCWQYPWDDWRGRQITVRRPAHLDIYNPSLDVTLRVCLFDALCRRVLYSGRVLPRATLRLDACTDEDVGLVYLLYERGQAYRLKDVHASFTKWVVLPIHEGYYPP